MTELDEALALRTDGDGRRCLAFADPRFESVNGMFGGWSTAVLLRAVMDHPDRAGSPCSVTVNFVRRVDPGSDVSISVQRVGGGRSLQHWRAEMRGADDSLLAHAVLVFGARAATDGFAQPQMPSAPDPDTLDEFHPPSTQGQRVLLRPVSGHPPFARQDTRSVHWTRDTTGRRMDHLQLAYLADNCAPRSFFWSEGPRPSATMTFSVYFYASDEEMADVGLDYLLTEAVGTRAAASLSGQQVSLWSRGGVLLATSEQLCWYR